MLWPFDDYYNFLSVDGENVNLRESKREKQTAKKKTLNERIMRKYGILSYSTQTIIDLPLENFSFYSIGIYLLLTLGSMISYRSDFLNLTISAYSLCLIIDNNNGLSLKAE